MQNKKGFNDVVLLITLASILLFSAFMIPHLNLFASSNYDEYDTDAYISGAKGTSGTSDADSTGYFSFWKLLKNTGKLATFDIGDTLELPSFLRLLFGIMGVAITIIIVRNVWIGGGG